MHDGLIFLVTLGLFIGVFAAVIVLAVKTHQKTVARMAAFAERAGFTVVPGAR